MTGRDPRFLDVSRLLSPRSIAVIGASDQPGNLGGVAIALLQKFRYPGTIWPVNPRRPTVHGLACHASVRDLPGVPDLALFATGAETIPGLLRECIDAGVRAGVVWAGGFAETGGRGELLQREIADLCRAADFALAGPNGIGVINTEIPVTATFASFLTETDTLLRGNISIVSQSGGTATMAQAFAGLAGFGFRHTISSGNEAVLTTADFIHALAGDRETKVIAAYVEGVHDGERLIVALREARDAGKPVVMLKGGESAASARAAAAHTGALAGERRVWDAVFREAAVIRAASLEELLDISLFLSSTDLAMLPRGNGVAAVTFGGGGGVLSADQCVRNGLAMPRLGLATREKLRALVPPIAAIDNPVDLTPQVYNQPQWFALFGQALDAIAADPAIDTILLQFGPMAQRGMEVAQAICDFRRRCGKTVCVAWSLAPRGVPERLRNEGLYVFTEPARAIATLGKLVQRHVDASASRDVGLPPAFDFNWSAHAPQVRAGTVIPEHACHRLLAAAGLPVAAGRLARSERDALDAGREVMLPVAMKGISPAVTHRAAAGLVALGLKSDDEVREAYHRLRTNAERAGTTLEGIYVQHMVDADFEVLVSAFRDPVFGVMVSCGTGGNLVELIDDVTLERAPCTEQRALAMIRRLKLARMIERMQRPPDPLPLARFIARFSQLAAGAPWRRFVLEVNPVKWGRDGVTAVDGLLIVEEA